MNNLNHIIDLLDSDRCTAGCLLAKEAPDTCSCRCGEKYHGHLRGLADGGMNSLVGLWFLTFSDTACGKRELQLQGIVQGEIQPGVYLVLFFSALDGSMHSLALRTLDEMKGWEFQDNKEWSSEKYSQYNRAAFDHLRTCPTCQTTTEAA